MVNGVSATLTYLPQEPKGTITMFQFSRQKTETIQSTTLMNDRDLKSHKVYGEFLGNQSIANLSLTKNCTVQSVIQIGRRVLGDDVWEKLVQMGGRKTLNVAAEIIEDHFHMKDQYKNKDLQLNLAVNTIKELSMDKHHKAHYCAAGEEIIQKLNIEVNFRKEIEHVLLDTGAIYNSYLVISRS